MMAGDGGYGRRAEGLSPPPPPCVVLPPRDSPSLHSASFARLSILLRGSLRLRFRRGFSADFGLDEHLFLHRILDWRLVELLSFSLELPAEFLFSTSPSSFARVLLLSGLMNVGRLKLVCP
ncbi:hypothetical protein Droror1_Dr00027059 [Drosera rotundifolia]